MFNGSIVALITPFSNNSIDEKALARLVHFHLQHGTHGIVAVGTTGEASTLTHSEHKRVIDIVVQEAGKQVPVIAGAGSNNTTEAIAYAEHASSIGADAVLHVAGYYNRPSQEGIFQHFKALDETTGLPIIAYNVPARTIVDIQPATMARLAGLTNVIGVKDATCDLSRPLREQQLISKEFCYLSGEDPTAVAYNAHGGQGCISVTANVAPALCSQLQLACAEQQFQTAVEIQQRLLPLHQALFMEPSPACVKYASSLLGLNEAGCRLPMVELEKPTRNAIENAMQELALV